MQLKWKNVDFVFIILANVNRCDLPQRLFFSPLVVLCICVWMCVCGRVAVTLWGTQMNWMNAKCGCCVVLLYFSKVMRSVSNRNYFLFSVSSLFLANGHVTSDDWLLRLHVWASFDKVSLFNFFFVSFLLSPINSFVRFCEILGDRSFSGSLSFTPRDHMFAICMQCGQMSESHYGYWPGRNGCKILRSPKIWKRQKELIKLQSIRWSAKLQMRCRHRPTANQFPFAIWIDELLHDVSRSFETFAWAIGQDGADGSQRDTYFIWIINFNLIRNRMKKRLNLFESIFFMT